MGLEREYNLSYDALTGSDKQTLRAKNLLKEQPTPMKSLNQSFQLPSMKNIQQHTLYSVSVSSMFDKSMGLLILALL